MSASRLRLLVVTESAGGSAASGAEVFCGLLVSQLARRHRVTLIAARGEPPAKLTRWHEVDLALAADPELLSAELADQVQVEDFDLVYNLGGLAYSNSVVAALASNAGALPLVNHFQALLGPYAATEGLDEELRQFNEEGQRQAAEAATVNIFLSAAELQLALAAGYDLAGTVGRVVPAAVDGGEFASLQADVSFLDGLGGSRPVVFLTAGRFSDYAKGGDLVYRAFVHLAGERDDVFLLAVTDSPRFTELLEGLPPERYRLLPWQPRGGFLRLLAAADAVVVPSRYESFGLVAVEAMMLGLPVIAIAVGGLQEVVQHRRTGLLSELDDGSYGLLCAMRALAADPALRGRLGRAGRLRACREYALDRVDQLVEACLERALLSVRSLSRRVGCVG